MKQQSPGMEDYLEAIAILAEENGVVRVTQLSKTLEVKKPGVNSALNKLSQKGLVSHERYGYVELTAEGRKVAEDVLRRHEALRKFLAEILRVNPDTAWEDDCKMEHFASPSITESLPKFVESLSTCPKGRPECLEAFDYYLEHGIRGEDHMSRCHGKDE